VANACLYTRISSDPNADTDEGGLGVARQEQDCRALADRFGWTVAHVYSDNDISAYNGKRRPGFEAMLDAVKRGQYDVLVCWHPDRLYRSMKDLEHVIEVCDAAGVPIRTVNGGDLDLSNATGKMLARILGSVNRQESEHKAERQRRANIQRAEAGSWWSSHRVFGYTLDGRIEPREAKAYRAAAGDILAGRSLSSIMREWNDKAILTAVGKPWQMFPLKRVLMNPRHAGLRVYKGEVVGPGRWRAIIDPDTHAGLVAVLSDPTRGRNVGWERKFLGSFRCVCGRCGAPMQHYTNKGYSRYRCSQSAHLSRTQPELDELVEDAALEYLRDTKRLHKILAARKGKDADPGELRARRAALIAHKDELATLFADGVLDGPAVRRESGKLAQKIGALDAALADLARRSPLAELLSAGVDKLDERWAAASPDIKGKILDELVTVAVNPAPKGPYFQPEYIEFRWHGPQR
jgi:site-specific DNA recombinase